jgi:hypothetical protein
LDSAVRGCSSQNEQPTTCCWSLHVDSRPLACRLPGVDGGGTLNSTIEQVQPKHPELRTSHRFASICTGKEKFIIDAVQQHLQLRCCIMSSGRTGWRSACFCRDGDTLAFWIPQTWHVHVAVLPRRHRCHRHQGYGKGSRSMRVESSRILGESSCCNSAATSLIQTDRLWRLSSATAATQNRQPDHLTGLQAPTCKSTNYSHPASHVYDNRHHGFIRQELHPRPSHGLPSHRHHRRRHHGRQRGGRRRRTH